MAFQHGLGVGPYEDKDIVNQEPLVCEPILLGTDISLGTDVYGIFPQAAFNRLDINPATPAITQIDYIIPQYDWYRGPGYFFTRWNTPNLNFTGDGNAIRPFTVEPMQFYALMLDPAGFKPGSGPLPFDPNPNLALADAFRGGGWLRITKGLWYPLKSWA
jgi:hypothetical protein